MKSNHWIANFSALLLIFASVGCASSEKDWYRAGATPEQVRRDLAGCKYRAKLGENPLAMMNVGFAMAEGLRQKDLVKNCMIEKGYIPAKEAKKFAETEAVARSAAEAQRPPRNIQMEQRIVGRWDVYEHEAADFIKSLHDPKNDAMYYNFNPDNTFSAVNQGAPGSGARPFMTSGTWAVFGNVIYLGSNNVDMEPAPIVFSGSEMIFSMQNIGTLKMRKAVPR